MIRNTPGENDPNQTEMLLTRLMLRLGEQNIATALGIGKSSVSRKINGQEGVTLRQLGVLLPLLGLRLVSDDDDEIACLKVFARKYLESL